MVISHFHLFCGIGGGALGFNQGRVQGAAFRCIGGVDSDPSAIQDFGALAGTPGTVLDLFNREQYTAWHGHAPPQDWREATPADLRGAAQEQEPQIVFLSAPCKGFSGLLSGERSASPKYQALNQLALRGLMLTLATWTPAMILFENVPRIASRGRVLLDQITAMLHAHGYAVAETTHDCGELGGLSQHRRRFLLVARHMAKVPAFVCEPPKVSVRAVGEVLATLPVPGEGEGGAMHALPRLSRETWQKLAAIPAGGDWRDIGGGAKEGAWSGAGHYGVIPWTEPAGAVTANAGWDNGRNSVADPRRAVSADGTWHRPLTTLELAVLQGFPADLALRGTSHAGWRERIGNAVPPPAARAIAEAMGKALLRAAKGQTFILSATPVWVEPARLS